MSSRIYFNHNKYPWKADIDYKKNPELYLIGKGEQGVLICEPYKSMLIKHWRFKTPEIAKVSSSKIYRMFLSFLKQKDFVGADLARKFLQMGYTRARRYANYKGGKKYNKEQDYQLNPRGTGETLKAKSANIFYKRWRQAAMHPNYLKLKSAWKARIYPVDASKAT